MKIKFWGVRGSMPTPVTNKMIQEKLRRALTLAYPGDISSEDSIEKFIESLPFSVKSTYGGNSTNLEIRTESGELIIIDCGTGIKMLGEAMMKEDFGKGKGIGTILLTHTHWDHIHGIPFFLPFYVEGNIFNIFSPIDNCRERLEYQQVDTHFPVDLHYMRATKNFYQLEKEGEFYLNDVKIINKKMQHPGDTFGYRIEDNGKSFVYTSDCEFNLEEIDRIDTYKDFFYNADVVVFDTQYTFEEYVDKIDWGHTTASFAIDIAAKFNVDRLILFHHDPNYDDEKLDHLLSDVKAYMGVNLKGRKLNVDIAYEGMEIDL